MDLDLLYANGLNFAMIVTGTTMCLFGLRFPRLFLALLAFLCTITEVGLFLSIRVIQSALFLHGDTTQIVLMANGLLLAMIISIYLKLYEKKPALLGVLIGIEVAWSMSYHPLISGLLTILAKGSVRVHQALQQFLLLLMITAMIFGFKRNKEASLGCVFAFHGVMIFRVAGGFHLPAYVDVVMFTVGALNQLRIAKQIRKNADKEATTKKELSAV